MSKRCALWLRATVVIMAMLLSQIRAAAAVDFVPATDAGGRTASVQEPDGMGGPASVSGPEPTGGLLLPDDPKNGEKVLVNSFLLASPLGPGGPNPALPPPGGSYGANVETTYPQESAVTRQTGATLSWLVVIQNSTAAEQLTDVKAELVFWGTGDASGTHSFMIPLVFPNADAPGVLESGELAWGVLDYQVPGNLNGDLVLRTRGAAEDGPPDDLNYDVVDVDDDYVNIQGPGFDVVSFEPDLPPPYRASPGDSIDFEIVIRNIRPGNVISQIAVDPQDPGNIPVSVSAFITACNGIGNWTLSEAGAPNAAFDFNETASCIISDVIVPNDPAPKTFEVAGKVTATDTGGLSVDQNVESSAVTINLPAVSITKTVVDIKRGTQVVSPPAAPGDRITYLITVKNSGQVPLDRIWVIDSLIGPLFIDQGMVLGAGEEHGLPPVTFVVPANSPDPLTNTASVTAHAVGTGSTVSASTAVSVDVADSALEVELSVVDPSDGITLVDQVVPPQAIRYRMMIRNTGQGVISGINYVDVLPPLQTVGSKPLLGITLGSGETEILTWDYVVDGSEGDPLTSTIKLKGTDANNRLVYAQDQATVDMVNPNISIGVAVENLETDTVLRGGEVTYRINVTNHSAAAVCDVIVNQFRRDPDTGFEMPVITNVPMPWAVPNTLTSGETVSGTVTYLVTGSDKDPLHMIFEVSSRNGCPGDGVLSDRTAKVLDLSDAQVNAQILVDLGDDGVAQVGDDLIFDYGATNVGSVTLENLSAEYCFVHRAAPDALNCDTGAVTITTLTKTSIGSFEDTSASFPAAPGYRVTEADADVERFTVQVTLYGLDNEAKQVSIKTAKTIEIASSDLQLELSGPQEAVEGDTVTIEYTLTNSSQVIVANVHVYNMLVPDASDPYGYLDVGQFNSILPGLTVTGSFDYTILPGVGITEGILTMVARAVGETEVETVRAADTLDILLIPMVGVLKTGDASRVAGQPLTYQVTIFNNSTEQILTITGYEDTVLADPAYNIPVSHDDFGAADADWPGGVKGQLPPGESVTATFTIPAPPGVKAAPNPLTNVFTVTGTRSLGNTIVTGFGSHSVNIECPISFTVKQPLNQDDEPDDILGEVLRWEITASNNSLDEITDIVIADTLNWAGDVPIPESSWPSQVGVLGPGQSVTLPAFETLITSDYFSEGLGMVSEELTATFSPIAGTPSCEQAFSYPVYSPIAILKLPDRFVAFTGEEVTYWIYLENLAEADDAPYDKFYIEQVTDSLLQGPIPFDFNHDGTIDPGETAGWLLPPDENEPNQHWVETTVVRVVEPDDPEELTNTVTAFLPDPEDPEMTLYTWYEATVFTGNPLQVEKKASVSQATPGNEMTYDYTITNVSPYVVDRITLTDDVIGDLIPRLTGGEITLQPNESISLSESYTIPVAAPDPLVNTVMAAGTVLLNDGQTHVITSEAVASIDLIDPDVSITKSAVLDSDGQPGEPLPDLFPATLEGGDGMPEAEVGVPVHFCFLVENTSTSNSTFVRDILIEDNGPGVPPGTLQPLFEAAVESDLQNPSPNREAGQSNWLYGGEAVRFCYGPVSLNPVMHGDPVVNVVSLNGTSSGGAAVFNDDELAIDLVGATLLITKLPSQPLAYVGEEVFYQIRIQNKHGSAVIDKIVVEDAFAGSAPGPISPDAFDWSTNNNEGLVATLGPGGFATYNYAYTIKPSDPDPLPNTARVTGMLNEVEPVPVEDSTRATVAVTQSQLLVRKTATPSVANPGEAVRYQISITNIGKIPVYNVRAVDAHYGVEVVFEGDDLSDVDLNPLETAYIFYTQTMPTMEELATQPNKDPFINTITVYGDISDEHGNPQQVQADATESVDILNPNIRIAKTPETQAATQGQEVSYTITVTNRGGEGDTLEQIVVRDVTAGLEYRLDELCADPGSVSCTFEYTAQPYASDGTPNPKAGSRYSPALGLESREQVTGTIKVLVPEDWPLSEFTNVAEAVARLRANPDRVVRDRTSAAVDIREAGINVEKYASPSAAPVGTPISYMVRVTNVGTTPLDKLVITDLALPGGHVTIENGFPETIEMGDQVDDTSTLDPGEIYEYPYTYTLQVDDADPYVNRVSVTGYAGGTGVLNTAQTVVDIQSAAVAVEKDVCRENAPLKPDVCTNVARVGETVTYYLHLYNPSMIEIQNISLADTLVPASVFDAISWPISGRPGVLAPDDEQPGGQDEVYFTYTYTVQQGDADPIVNLVTVTAQSPEPVTTVQDTDTAVLNLVTSDLHLSKTSNATDNQAVLGRTVEYTLTLTNLNPDPDAHPITGVTVVDAMSPYGVGPVPGCTVASLGRTPVSCTYEHVVATADGTPLVNTAVATGMQGGVLVTDVASSTIEIVAAGLSVMKTADTTVAAIGQTVTYTYRIENTGTITLNDLDVRDSDPGVVFMRAGVPTPWPAYLAPGRVEVRTGEHTITSQDPDPYLNTVIVSAKAGSQTRVAQATETVFVSNSGLVVTNVPNVAHASPGGSVIFAYTAMNVGDDPLSGLALSDNLGSLALTPDQQSLEPGESVTVYRTMIATLPGPVISTAYAQATSSVGTVYDTATAEVPVTDGELLVTKAADRLLAGPGQTVTYTVEVTNVGESALTDFIVDDPMIVLNPPPPAALLPGQSFLMIGTYTVPAGGYPASLSNTVTVTAMGSNGLVEDSDSASVTVVDDPATATVVLTKEASTQRAQPGSAVDYVLRIMNVGSDPSPVVVSVEDPPGTPLAVTIPPLLPGNMATITTAGTVPGDWVATEYTNTAQVLVGGDVQDTASATVLIDLLELTKMVVTPGPVAPGDRVDYRFEIASHTSGTVTGVTLSDPNITWDEALPATIPPEGAFATGHLTIPVDFDLDSFENTAQVAVNGEVVDDSSAAIEVAKFEVEILSIAQYPSGLTMLQTGKDAEIAFVMRNHGDAAVTEPVYAVRVDGAVVSCTHLEPDPELTTSLAPGSETVFRCRYSLPMGAANNPNLNPEVTVAAGGLMGDVPASDTAAQTVQVVDLQLGVELLIEPNPAQPGETVSYSLILTNEGASPIGCDATVPEDALCHFRPAFSDPDITNLFGSILPDIQSAVLLPGETRTFLAPQTREVGEGEQSAVVTVSVEGGYSPADPAFPNDAALREHADDYTTLGSTIVEFVVAQPEITVSGTVTPPNPMLGEMVRFDFFVQNSGTVPVSNLAATYTITPVGSTRGILLVSGHTGRPAQATTGTLTLSPTALEPDQIAMAILVKAEDQTQPYVFQIDVTGTGLQGGEVTASLDLMISPTLAGTPTPTPMAGLDPNATEPIVTKTASADAVEPGDSITWTLTVRNGGTMPMTNITLQDPVPDSLTISSATVDRGTSFVDGQVITISAAALEAGATITVIVNTVVNETAQAPGTIENTACAAREGGEQTCSTATVTVGPGALTLPATGIRSPVAPRGLQDGSLSRLALALALMLLLSVQASNQRMLIAVIFVAVAVTVVMAGLVLLLTQDDDSSSQGALGESPGDLLPSEGTALAPFDEPGGLVFTFPPTPTPYVLPSPAGARSLMIPRLGEQFSAPIPIVELPLEDQQWDVSGLGNYVGWLEGTTWLDQKWGNTVLAAHVQLGFQNPGPFWGLGELQPGDEIIVVDGDTERLFTVQSTRTVSPTDLSVTRPTSHPTLTLITCTDWNNARGVFAQRMVVEAMLAES